MSFNPKTKQIIRLMIIVLALALFIVLLISAIREKSKQRDSNKEPEVKVEPVLEQLNKCYVVNNDGNTLTVLSNGETREFTLDTYYYNGNQQIIDLFLTDGKITNIVSYDSKINEKLISIKDNLDSTYSIELNNYGVIKTSSDIQVFNIMGEIQQSTLSDLTIGYNFTDYVLNDKKEIVAALIVRQEDMEQIRVLIKNNQFESVYHESVLLSCDVPMDITAEGSISTPNSISENTLIMTTEADTELTISPDSDLFKDTNRVLLKPSVLSSRIRLLSLNRNQGVPEYRGTLEIEKTDNGLVLTNELPLEEYLYSVVPSEMPSSYPAEALKAQAVCARTYAYTHMRQSTLQNYGAHLDDSTAYQVYNNIAENPNTSQAVSDTSKEIIYTDQGPAVTYFYSTSCGYGTDLSAWNLSYDDPTKCTEGYLKASKIGTGESLDLTNNETFDQYIRSVDKDCFEKDEKYYRWCYETSFDPGILLNSIQKKYEKDPEHILTLQKDGSYLQQEITDPGIIKNISVNRRTAGGVATELLIEGTDNTFLIEGENNIRNILANQSTDIKLGADYQSTGNVNGALPSAFLSIELKYENVQPDMKEINQGKTDKESVEQSKSNKGNVDLENDDQKNDDQKNDDQKNDGQNNDGQNKSDQENINQNKDDPDNVIISGYAIYGGGYGHGIGMSQNGAKDMAKEGYSYKEILDYFYAKKQ